MNLLYLTQLYRKHLSQYLYLCILDSQYLIMKNSCACFLFTGVCQLSHLPTSPWCQLLLPWWLYPPRADFDFPTHSPCQRPYCEDCLWYKSRDECFMLRPYSTYHCVNQLHIFLHFLFSVIICDPWKTKSLIVMSGDILSCSHLAMWPARPWPWPPPAPPPGPPPGPRSSPRHKASSSVNFLGLKPVPRFMNKTRFGSFWLTSAQPNLNWTDARTNAQWTFLEHMYLPLPEFWYNSAAEFHPLESLLGGLHVIVNGDQARLYLLKLLWTVLT